MRITPQLIRVADDTHLWADSYDRVIEDIFAVQSEMAQNVLDKLGVTLLKSERSAVQGRGTPTSQAEDCFQKALDVACHQHAKRRRTVSFCRP